MQRLDKCFMRSLHVAGNGSGVFPSFVRQIRDYVEVDNPALFMVSLPQARKDPCFQNFFNGRFSALTGNNL